MISNGQLTYSDKSKQLKYDRAYLRMAHEWSMLSHCKRKQVGALIVKNGMIISDGYNGAPTGIDNNCEDESGATHWYILHAEANAISKVARSNNNAEDSTLYLTMSPCKECCKLILQVGIKRVVFSSLYADESGMSLLQNAGIQLDHIPIENNESKSKYE